MNCLPQEDRQRLLNALHWWRRACMEEERHTLFLFQWFAIEALSGLSFVASSMPKKMGRKYPKVQAKISHLIVTLSKLWSASECSDRYDLRCRVAHGDMIISPQEEEKISGLIDQMHTAIEGILHRILRGEY
jgi:hypothetical protein